MRSHTHRVAASESGRRHASAASPDFHRCCISSQGGAELLHPLLGGRHRLALSPTLGKGLLELGLDCLFQLRASKRERGGGGGVVG